MNDLSKIQREERNFAGVFHSDEGDGCGCMIDFGVTKGGLCEHCYRPKKGESRDES